MSKGLTLNFKFWNREYCFCIEMWKSRFWPINEVILGFKNDFISKFFVDYRWQKHTNPKLWENNGYRLTAFSFPQRAIWELEERTDAQRSAFKVQRKLLVVIQTFIYLKQGKLTHSLRFWKDGLNSRIWI